MSDIPKHIEQYKHNKDFLETIDGTAFADWKITVCFYCSLHKVIQCLHYAYDAEDSDHETHTTTRKFLKNKNISLAAVYGQLYSLSKEARYNCIDVTGKVKNAESLLTKIENMANTIIQQKALEKSKNSS